MILMAMVGFQNQTKCLENVYVDGHNDGTYGYQPASFSSSPVFVQWNHENGGHNSYAWALQYRFSFTRAGLAPDGCPTAETNPGFYLQDGERGGVELDTF